MKIKRVSLLPLLILMIAAMVGSGFAQTSLVEGKLSSKLMGREMPYRVITPTDYASSKEKRYPVIYLLHGLTGHYSNWSDTTPLAKYAVGFNAIIVMPEGDNGWYTDSVSKANDKYESYIVKELIPEIDGKYRTIADRKNRAIAGLSMGGYGGLKFGLKYPEMFSLAGSFSGALSAASFTEKTAGVIGKGIDEIYGPTDGEVRKSNDVFEIVRNASPEKIKTFPFLYVDCGTEDFLIGNNRDFSALLLEKKIPHEFRQLPGGHTWPYWDKQVQEFLRIAERSFSAK
ncbi:MAG: alpha/beta hydrolase [Pyrinomonadaceae bacterium]